MIKIVGVKFKDKGKIYYFDPKDIMLRENDSVIVETVRGTEYAKVVSASKEVSQEDVKYTLKPVIRKATKDDELKYIENKEKEKKAFSICKEKIEKHGLDMALINVEYTFDNAKIIFNFTSNDRVDFRELVKDLASVFRTRIELRQVGVRDQAKEIGALGSCGRESCCAKWMADFQPVSIKMAKNQNLSLNPTKISGSCGRLMCCLSYEDNTYSELRKEMPKVGSKIDVDGIVSPIIELDVLKGMAKVKIENEEEDTYEYRWVEINKG